MKIKLILLLFASSILLSFTTKSSQDEPLRYFVQFKIFTLTTYEQAQEIDEKMMSKSGVMASRTDFITSTYFCFLYPGINISEETFVNWFKKMGYEIGCFHKGIQNIDDSVTPHTLKDCTNEK